MAKTVNPFIVSGRIDPEFFCDRTKESEKLLRSVTNGNNIVLISPRRMGKTGLIRFCYDNPEISGEYYTFFIDILHTSSLREFTYTLGKEIFSTMMPLGSKMAGLVLRTLKSISGNFGFDPMTGLPTFSLELGDITRPEYTLEEIFSCLDNADKPCIVAIDEFQQIEKYQEKNIESLLRTHIQTLGSTKFVFAGSERHIMQEMFNSSARPFYRSADLLELEAIPKDVYAPFICNLFEKFEKKVSRENAEYVYDMFKGHTYYIQKIFNESFAYTPAGGECTKEIIDSSLANIIEAYSPVFMAILSNMPEKQKELLYAIAKDGEARHITSSAFVRGHKLSSASSVQSATRKLLAGDFITTVGGKCSVTDKLFAMWIVRYI